MLGLVSVELSNCEVAVHNYSTFKGSIEGILNRKVKETCKEHESIDPETVLHMGIEHSALFLHTFDVLSDKGKELIHKYFNPDYLAEFDYLKKLIRYQDPHHPVLLDPDLTYFVFKFLKFHTNDESEKFLGEFVEVKEDE